MNLRLVLARVSSYLLAFVLLTTAAAPGGAHLDS